MTLADLPKVLANSTHKIHTSQHHSSSGSSMVVALVVVIVVVVPQWSKELANHEPTDVAHLKTRATLHQYTNRKG